MEFERHMVTFPSIVDDTGKREVMLLEVAFNLLDCLLDVVRGSHVKHDGDNVTTTIRRLLLVFLGLFFLFLEQTVPLIETLLTTDTSKDMVTLFGKDIGNLTANPRGSTCVCLCVGVGV
jgi:hypothetical protein